jgi:hypothetical protein
MTDTQPNMYATLADIHTAIHQGEPITLMIDNDSVSAVSDEYADVPGPTPLDTFEIHPEQLLEDALDLLGIPHEHV